MLNVTYPLIEDEVVEFCRGKRAVLVVEEGQPEFIEQAIAAILSRTDLRDQGGRQGPAAARRRIHRARSCAPASTPSWPSTPARTLRRAAARAGAGDQRASPRGRPGFCTGCPERPVFTAMKLLQREIGPVHVSCDIGCHLFSILPPFNIGNTTMGYGLGWAGASAFNAPGGRGGRSASWATAASGTTA